MCKSSGAWWRSPRRKACCVASVWPMMQPTWTHTFKTSSAGEISHGALILMHNRARISRRMTLSTRATALISRGMPATPSTCQHVGAQVHHQRYATPRRTHSLHPPIPCGDCARLRRLSQAVGARSPSCPRALSMPSWWAAVGAAAGQPLGSSKAGERAPDAAQPCGRRRDAQERRPGRYASPDATSPSGCVREASGKSATGPPSYLWLSLYL